MKFSQILTVAAAITVMSAVQAKAIPGIVVTNGGFEDPYLGSGTAAYGYGPDYANQTVGTNPYFYPGLPSTPSGWTFVGTSGIAANGSAFGVTGAGGNQAALLESTNGLTNGSIEQDIFLPGAGLYTVSFSLEGRAANDGPNEIEVLFGGNTVYLGTPSSTTSFEDITTVQVYLTGGNQLLSFSGINSNSGDYTTFLDDVSVNFVGVPEPANWAWLPVLGLLGAISWRRMKRVAVVA